MHGCCSFSFEYSSTTISNVWVIGLLRDHPSLLKVELPICDNSGMYAMVSPPFCGLILFDVGQTYPCVIDSMVLGCFVDTVNSGD